MPAEHELLPPTADGKDPLAEDFRAFLWAIWQHLGLPDPTPVQYDIALWLQHGPRRLITEAFRGVGKSWITVSFAAWHLYRDPQVKIEVVSASKRLADDFSTFLLRLIEEVPFLRFLRPRDDQRSSKVAFDVGPAKAAKDPSVKSVGITGQITGSRADLIIADDVEVPSNTMTQVQRDKLSELVKEFDAVLKPGGRVVYLGTPQTEQSLYQVLTQRGYVARIWPARYPVLKDLEGGYGDALAPKIRAAVENDGTLVGRPTDPKRFTHEDLIEREISYGKAGFNLQFMLDTRLSDANRYPLKLKDLIVMPLDAAMAPATIAWGASPEGIINDIPHMGLNGDKLFRPIFSAKEWMPYTGSVLYVDPSGRGHNETSWAVVKFLNGVLYCHALDGRLGGYEDETLNAIVADAKAHKVHTVLVESNFGDGMFTKLLQPALSNAGHLCAIEEVRNSSQKEKRVIDILEPVMMRHRLVMNEEVLRKDSTLYEGTLAAEKALKYRLTYQLTRLTAERGSLLEDDRIEALAGACHYFVESMVIGEKEAVERVKEAARQAELDKFRESYFKSRGRPEDKPRWTTLGSSGALGHRNHLHLQG